MHYSFWRWKSYRLCKGYKFTSYERGLIEDYKFPFINLENNIPIIAIPTTAGTGSEVTKFTIITNEKTDEKMLCVGPSFMPIAAIVDYELTYSVPQKNNC